MNKHCITMIDINDEHSHHKHQEYSSLTKMAWQKYCDKNNIDFF